MRHRVDFTKVSGAGNDFVLVDNMNRLFNLDWVRFARAVCSRHFGIGADGLLAIEPSAHADFAMKYFNADGSYGGMCGNGGRCVARYAYLKGIAGPTIVFEALGDRYEARIEGSDVKLRMKDVKSDWRRLTFALDDGKMIEGWFVDSSSPHIVISCADTHSAPVQEWGREIRVHSQLQPEGANVNFYAPQGRSSIALRTYERGVEAETMACGTGAVASAIVAFLDARLTSPIAVSVRSGETLIVGFDFARDSFTNVTLQGSAHILFNGTVNFDDGTGQLSGSTTR